jgi:hypothetical protein
MLNRTRWFTTALSFSLVCFLPAVLPISAQAASDQAASDQTPSDTAETSDSSETDETLVEDPELPESLLILPEEDPAFVPDPNRIPLENDFLFMPQTRNPLFWRLELRDQVGGISNAQQAPGGVPSLSNRLSLSGVLRYTLPSETQILARSQAFLFNFLNAPDQDRLLGIPLSLTVSQWLGRWNLYGGYVPLVYGALQSNTPNGQRFDQDFLLGATYYMPIDNHYFFAGYQLDYLMAQQATSQFVGNQLLAGYRHTFHKDVFGFLDARVQPRTYIGTTQLVDELNMGAGAALQWHVLRPWLILEARTDYNQTIGFSSSQRDAGVFALGINLIGALQSQN